MCCKLSLKKILLWSFFFIIIYLIEKIEEVPPPDVSSDQPTFSDILTVPNTGSTNAESKDAEATSDNQVSEGKNSNRHED